MGTRADFYLGRGAQATWLGSIAWDGHPGSIEGAVLSATDADQYRSALATFLKDSEGILPSDGWPWPWEDSRLTDYAYALDAGKVYANYFGHGWFDPLDPQGEEKASGPVVFPDMSQMKQAIGKTGFIVLGLPHE